MSILNVLIIAIVFLWTSYVSQASSSDCPEGFDATKFLQTFQEGYIQDKSFNTNLVCALFTQTETKDSFKVANYNVTYRTNGQTQFQTQLQSFRVQSRQDQVDVVDAQRGNVISSLTLIYSDPGKCAIFRGNRNPSQCSLYVNADISTADINSCASWFPLLCGETFYEGKSPDAC